MAIETLVSKSINPLLFFITLSTTVTLVISILFEEWLKTYSASAVLVTTVLLLTLRLKRCSMVKQIMAYVPFVLAVGFDVGVTFL